MSEYLIDEFVGTRLGTPYRLFPFGAFVKNGKTREITAETARAFRLPHFKPAIKLGSHEDTTPAGGHIVKLEVRDDGLYAVPEWNDKGEEALKDGAYRYHSPEVLWENGALENPATGEPIAGPLILGDALLHTPHLGDQVAMYSVQPAKKEIDKMTETVEVPKSFWDKLSAVFAQPERQDAAPVVVAETEEYKAVAQERDEFKAKWEAHEAEQKRKEAIVKFEAELKETKADPTLAETLAGLQPEQADAILRQLKALSAQVDAGALEDESGDPGASQADVEPVAAFDAAIQAKQAEAKVDYASALRMVATEKPELFDAYKKAKEKK